MLSQEFWEHAIQQSQQLPLLSLPQSMMRDTQQGKSQEDDV